MGFDDSIDKNTGITIQMIPENESLNTSGYSDQTVDTPKSKGKFNKLLTRLNPKTILKGKKDE